jgi:hypothetical protein
LVLKNVGSVGSSLSSARDSSERRKERLLADALDVRGIAEDSVERR